ncbi:hypothetical protein DAPPUDRAFT_321575 [Daphnia pulex]|uniref:Uncharacterized protein n=1 Tax=Daphnia pulex TaxID=6669 RepID=E9GT23_DAPPU|nr:hypothetical protein DAPPUDRAFT_321575 [Daphnia pulex]|eukprot:EFX77296.1 hypothetical protein DAPPUDRAFT_321575 [Daphnia pulex]
MSMKQAGPAAWIGLAYPSGWINADTFLESPKHFVTCTDCNNFRQYRRNFCQCRLFNTGRNGRGRVLFRHEGSSYLKKLSLIHKLVRMECQQHLEEQLFERASSVAQKKSLEQDLPRSNAKDSDPRRKQTTRTLSD